MDINKINQVRSSWEKTEDANNEGLDKHPKGIIRYDNLLYGTNTKYNLLDVYRPTKDMNKTIPLIINIHGGACIYSCKEHYQYYCMKFAQKGFAVVNFDYRLAPEYPYPSAWDDIMTVIRWCILHHQQYGFDLSRVFIIGDSSGATLAEQLLVLYSNPEFARKCNFKLSGINILGGIWHSGVYFPKDTTGLIDDLMSTYYLPDVMKLHEPLMNAYKYITNDLPPVFITSANQDWMLGQNQKMNQLLNKRHVKHEYKEYGDKDHQLPDRKSVV